MENKINKYGELSYKIGYRQALLDVADKINEVKNFYLGSIFADGVCEFYDETINILHKCSEELDQRYNRENLDNIVDKYNLMEENTND